MFWYTRSNWDNDVCVVHTPHPKGLFLHYVTYVSVFDLLREVSNFIAIQPSSPVCDDVSVKTKTKNFLILIISGCSASTSSELLNLVNTKNYVF